MFSNRFLCCAKKGLSFVSSKTPSMPRRREGSWWGNLRGWCETWEKGKDFLGGIVGAEQGLLRCCCCCCCRRELVDFSTPRWDSNNSTWLLERSWSYIQILFTLSFLRGFSLSLSLILVDVPWAWKVVLASRREIFWLVILFNDAIFYAPSFVFHPPSRRTSRHHFIFSFFHQYVSTINFWIMLHRFKRSLPSSALCLFSPLSRVLAISTLEFPQISRFIGAQYLALGWRDLSKVKVKISRRHSPLFRSNVSLRPNFILSLILTFFTQFSQDRTTSFETFFV